MEMSEFFGSLWFQAQEELGESDELVICGYSMPNADVGASRLILENINNNARVKVVSGSSSERVVQRFQENGFRSVQEIAYQRA